VEVASDQGPVEGLPPRPHIAFGRVTMVRASTATATTRPPTRPTSARLSARRRSSAESDLPTLHAYQDKETRGAQQPTPATRGALTPLIKLLPNGAARCGPRRGMRVLACETMGSSRVAALQERSLVDAGVYRCGRRPHGGGGRGGARGQSSYQCNIPGGVVVQW